MGFFGKLKGALKKTTDLLRTDVRDLFKAGEILDEPKLQEFEKRLLLSDMGFAAAQEIVTEVREKHGGRTVDVEAIWSTVKAKLRSLLKGDEDVLYDSDNPVSPLNLQSDGPTVILVSGVNGVGKTTSIAKLANLIQKSGKSVLLAAGDTFRAAAVEQLTMWSERLGCEIVTKPAGTDPVGALLVFLDLLKGDPEAFAQFFLAHAEHGPTKTNPRPDVDIHRIGLLLVVDHGGCLFSQHHRHRNFHPMRRAVIPSGGAPPGPRKLSQSISAFGLGSACRACQSIRARIFNRIAIGIIHIMKNAIQNGVLPQRA